MRDAGWLPVIDAAAVGRLAATLLAAAVALAACTATPDPTGPASAWSEQLRAIAADLKAEDPRVSELDALAARCERQYLTVIEATYVTQPVAVANLDRRFEDYRAAISACLSSAGIEVADGASRAEVEKAASESDAGLTCFEDSGYWN